MKFENKIKYNRLKEAIIRYVLGSSSRFIDAIPWSKELESVIPWGDVYSKINNAVDSISDENNKCWDVAKILTNPDELERFHNFITEKINKVMIAYQGIIDKANELCKPKFEITISKFVSVVNNEAKYERVYHYFGDNLTSLANEVYDKLKVTDWLRDNFIDSVHFSLYNNSHTVFKSNCINGSCLNGNHLYLEVKKNH